MSGEKEIASAIDGLAHAVRIRTPRPNDAEHLSVAIQDAGVRIGDALGRIATALEAILEKANAEMR